jgi:hypothetical protein
MIMLRAASSRVLSQLRGEHPFGLLGLMAYPGQRYGQRHVCIAWLQFVASCCGQRMRVRAFGSSRADGRGEGFSSPAMPWQRVRALQLPGGSNSQQRLGAGMASQAGTAQSLATECHCLALVLSHFHWTRRRARPGRCRFPGDGVSESSDTRILYRDL